MSNDRMANKWWETIFDRPNDLLFTALEIIDIMEQGAEPPTCQIIVRYPNTRNTFICDEVAVSIRANIWFSHQKQPQFVCAEHRQEPPRQGYIEIGIAK